MYKIEKGIPLTEEIGPTAQFLSKLEVGDSFVVKDDKERKKFLMCTYTKKITLTTRKLEDGSFRIWRTK